jgi:lipopolysaccharide/colanic/teichoic acid biosynthesis glycosyltransferase
VINAVRIAKRLVDVSLSAVGMAVTLPLYPIIAAAIYLESPGPVFYKQRRAGRLRDGDGAGGAGRRFSFEEFDMVKFRTMRPDAEKGTGAVLASVGDPRVTKVGAFLRKTRLDELPQLWCVLKGDMSLVGPRPERVELIENLALAIPYFEERMRGVKPGITGLAQISLGYTGQPIPGSDIAKYGDSLMNPFKLPEADGALADDMRMKLLYDLAYCASLENLPSFLRTELGIIARTPIVMLRGLGR